MAIKFVLCCAIAALAFSNVHALSDDERAAVKSAIAKHITACREEFGITEEQLKEAKAQKNLDSIDSCAIACFFRKIKFLTDDGIFDVEHAKEVGPKYLGSEDDQKKFNDVAEACGSVNDEVVSDGAKGCERARLLSKCIHQHKTEIKL